MQKKIERKFVFFEILASELVCVKLFLLRREYLLSALSVLGNSLEIFHVTNRDLLRVNSLHSDQ